MNSISTEWNKYPMTSAHLVPTLRTSLEQKPSDEMDSNETRERLRYWKTEIISININLFENSKTRRMTETGWKIQSHRPTATKKSDAVALVNQEYRQ